ncbi:MAG TPA: hypothetical protein VGB21_02525 [Candidatus Methylomirabilis sp.]
MFQLNRSLLNSHGINDDFLAKKLKDELKAKVIRLITLKTASGLFKGDQAESEDGDGGKQEEVKTPDNGGSNGNGHRKYKQPKEIYLGGTILSPQGSHRHVVIAVDEVDWSTRQRARMDAHKLRGDYPAEKRELSGSIGLADADRLIAALEKAAAAKAAAPQGGVNSQGE